MTHATCKLTAKNRDQLRNPTLGNRVWATFTFLHCGAGRTRIEIRGIIIIIIIMQRLTRHVPRRKGIIGDDA